MQKSRSSTKRSQKRVDDAKIGGASRLSNVKIDKPSVPSGKDEEERAAPRKTPSLKNKLSGGGKENISQDKFLTKRNVDAVLSKITKFQNELHFIRSLIKSFNKQNKHIESDFNSLRTNYKIMYEQIIEMKK